MQELLGRAALDVALGHKIIPRADLVELQLRQLSSQVRVHVAQDLFEERAERGVPVVRHQQVDDLPRSLLSPMAAAAPVGSRHNAQQPKREQYWDQIAIGTDI